MSVYYIIVYKDVIYKKLIMLTLLQLDCEERVIHGEKTAWCEEWTALATDDKYKNIDVTLNLNDTKIVKIY